jgi:hypothetical protein
MSGQPLGNSSWLIWMRDAGMPSYGPAIAGDSCSSTNIADMGWADWACLKLNGGGAGTFSPYCPSVGYQVTYRLDSSAPGTGASCDNVCVGWENWGCGPGEIPHVQLTCA